MNERLAFCLKCGECLGEDRPYFAKSHEEEYPDHLQFFIKTIIDPFSLPDLDSYLQELRPFSPEVKRNLFSPDNEREP